MRTNSIVENRPYVLAILRMLALVGLLCSLTTALLAGPAAAQDATPTPANINVGGDVQIETGSAYAKPEFPACGGMLFNIAIESMGPDRIEEYNCTFEMKDGKPTFKFGGNAICGKNSQVAFSGAATLTVDVFHAHVTCSPETDLATVIDGRSCSDGSYVEFIVNGRNAKNVDLTCDYKSLNDPKVVLTSADFAGICTDNCADTHFAVNGLGTNWYLNTDCNGTFTVPNAITVDGKEIRLDLVWFDKDGMPSRIQSGDNNPTATGACLAYLEPIAD